MTLINDKTHIDLQYLTADNIHCGGITAVFSTRNGGASGQTPETECCKSLNLQYHTDFDSNENVYQNYRIITSALGYTPENVASVHQIHSDKIVVIDKPIDKKPGAPETNSEKADALITNLPGVLLSVRMADCVPILLFDERNRAIAAIHSGWQGTIANIAVKTLLRMCELYNSKPSYINAAIGPCIGKCCYEVGFDFLERFRNEYGSGIDAYFDIQPDKKPHCDLRTMNKAFLIETGVRANNIEVSDLCTMCRPDLFYSHRRNSNKRGTMAAFIGMK